ncbi:protein MIZU-KUSSEI 1-like isoform X2 [Andrographis paniculata]|uniref:protein MIZU-KUSSEI 1-like isoform X2 n=1 Tax=Andrographis paniculata TaxID=175694 RepID=UPI0021E71712|nr:protein MIZU-KUSSEI 1-like isoform X2 [Andrographis paniculata]
MGGEVAPPSPPPTAKKKAKSQPRPIRLLRNVFRSFPIIFITSPAACRLPTDAKIISGRRVTGTLFGWRRGRVRLLVQESPHAPPTAVVEMSMKTQALQREMGLGMVRIALECEKRPAAAAAAAVELLEEPLWMMYCNGKKVGYAVRREATAEDRRVMEALRAVTMGAGVLPDGDLAYIRAEFDRVLGSRDSQTLYMEKTGM